MATSASSIPPGHQTKPGRSKNGCNACKRRKVRCNERHPRCGHCERLNLECTWNRPLIGVVRSRARGSQSASLAQAPSTTSEAQAPFDDGIFDFAGLNAWDEAMLLSPGSWPAENSFLETGQELGRDDFLTRTSPLQQKMAQIVEGTLATSPLSNASHAGQDEYLIDAFLQILMPPILVSVETGPKWASTRTFFANMAVESSMVKNAMMAFAAMQIRRTGYAQELKTEWQPLYETAQKQISAALSPGAKKQSLKLVLAALFLLIYIDLLTETLPRAHSNLRNAYDLLQKADKAQLSTPERRLISWLRLLDGRAVSTAGGEGLFLDDTNTMLEATPAPEPLVDAETDIKEILFDVLYHPGLIFFQKVQSFVGRITRIDPWHRSRGTVQDETEVMAIGLQISTDLNALYNQRPALMDHCVSGDLTEKQLAKDLAAPLTRSFRTYLANYYASYIHLQRVAYKQYPKTPEVLAAITNIKRLAHMMAESDEPFPVNILWPLLMWGCEEEDLAERQWISGCMRNLEDTATNARIAADLMEEVQRRQDELQQRVDVRKVSQEHFKSYHFAIV